MFNALAERGINIQVISTSEIKVSVLISEETSIDKFSFFSSETLLMFVN